MAAGCSRSYGPCRPGRGPGPRARAETGASPANGAVALAVVAGKDAFGRGGNAVAWRLVHRLWRAAEQAGRITADTPAGRSFASFGACSVIGFPTGALYGEPWIAIGRGPMLAAQ